MKKCNLNLFSVEFFVADFPKLSGLGGKTSNGYQFGNEGKSGAIYITID